MQTTLIYDRQAILDGEVWRFVTGHWVHFSASQLFWDGMVFGVTSYFIELRKFRYLPQLYLLSSVVSSLLMLGLLPEMAYYGGLSGIAMATTTYLALQGLYESAPWHKLSVITLILVILKLSVEIINDQFKWVDYMNDAIRTVPLSHLSGAGCAWIVYIWSNRQYKGKIHVE